MKIKLTLLALAALALLAAVRLYQAYPDSPPARAIRPWLAPLKQTVMNPGSASTEMHKCVSGTKTEYSSGKCPPGSREAAIGQGTMTVLPATPVAAATPASAAASLPTVRDLLAKPGEPSLEERRIERAIGN